jgi:hypothetical protein
MHGVRDVGLLRSAFERPRATFEKKDLYPDLFLKEAALIAHRQPSFPRREQAYSYLRCRAFPDAERI